jgi:methylenetetrahydrofolate--tRNA-(uracil-5-)-methyltransferase
MTALGSAVMTAARQTRVPAGKALAVDRELFARAMTEAVAAEPLITLVRREITSLRDPDLASAAAIVIAAGPLASEGLSIDLSSLLGESSLYFYDALAPIIAADSVDLSIAFWGSRYAPEEHDYLNCPFNREEYFNFHKALLTGQTVPLHEFEKEIHFEGCMPVEALAERGEMTLAFGSLKPVGFVDPRTGTRPFAVLQLRPENADKSAFNLVGCQTKLTYSEQERVFRLVPGLARAEFLRLGSMHRNTYVNAPQVRAPDLSLHAGPPDLPPVYLAGQITGVEGYLESAATGLWLGLDLAFRLQNPATQTGVENKAAPADLRGVPGLMPPPPETALGALLAHLQRPAKNFQPSNINFGLMPAPEERLRKKDRKAAYSDRAATAFQTWLAATTHI